MNLGVVLLELGRGPEAAITLRPVAYNPHGGKMATAARSTLDRLAKEPTWRVKTSGFHEETQIRKAAEARSLPIL